MMIECHLRHFTHCFSVLLCCVIDFDHLSVNIRDRQALIGTDINRDIDVDRWVLIGTDIDRDTDIDDY